MKTTAARSAASSSSRVTILLPARNAAHPITGRATGSWGTAPTRHYTVMDMPLPRRIRLRSKNQARLPTIPTPLPRKCVACDAELDGDAVFCTHCGARQPGAGEKYRPPILQDTTPDPSQYPGTIEGEAAADVAAVVRTNTGYFLPRFRRNKKVGWNWAAFLFGPYYLFFRKMYKEGTAALAIRFAAALIVQGAYASQFAKLTDFMSTNYTALMQGKIQPDAALVEPLYPAVAILMGVGLAIHLVIALFANRLYHRKVFTVLQTVDDRLQDGAIFRQAPMLPEQMRLTQDEMRRMYLSKMGGTSVFAPIMAFLILDMISGLLSSIL